MAEKRYETILLLLEMCGGGNCKPCDEWRNRMAEKLTFQYDREADILYINTVPPYAEQESEELEDEIIVRLNPKTRKVENFEVLFFTSRLLRSELFSLPVIADLRPITTN